MNKLEELKKMIEIFEEDYNKLTEKGNKTAGTRARKTLQDIRNWSKDMRMEISNTKREQTV